LLLSRQQLAEITVHSKGQHPHRLMGFMIERRSNPFPGIQEEIEIFRVSSYEYIIRSARFQKKKMCREL
jgi:proteasome lid subunit RPN8/RPN11